jgi:hypothetical protein
VIAILVIGVCKRKTDASGLYTVSKRGAERDRAFQRLIDD